MSHADQASIAEALRRIKDLETLVAHLAALGPLNHGPCRVCRELMPADREPMRLITGAATRRSAGPTA